MILCSLCLKELTIETPPEHWKKEHIPELILLPVQHLIRRKDEHIRKTVPQDNRK